MAESFFPLQRAPYSRSQRNSFERNNNNSCESTMNSRARFTLPLNHMAIPIYTSPPSRQDVEDDGRLLFQNFIHEQLVDQGLPENAIELTNPPPDVFGDAGTDVYTDSTLEERAVSPALTRLPEGFNNQHFIALGATVRDLADEFGKSHQRLKIKEHADQVDLSHINQTTFTHMMDELFRNGIDKYCIVALFFLCSDILIRCVKEELFRTGSKLFFWALDFLFRKVCKWVYDNGGWEKVLSKFYNVAMKVSAAVAVGVIITCGIIFIRKNL